MATDSCATQVSPTRVSQDRMHARPLTAFGDPATGTAKFALSSVDWILVIQEEAGCVVDWLLYLPSEDPEALLALLQALSFCLDQMSHSCSQWRMFVENGLSVVLVDMLVDMDVWKDEELSCGVRVYSLSVCEIKLNTHQSINRGLAILKAFCSCLNIITSAFFEKQDVERCLAPILGKVEKLYETLWNNRHLIPLVPTGGIHDLVHPPGCAHWAFLDWSTGCVMRALNLHFLYL